MKFISLLLFFLYLARYSLGPMEHLGTTAWSGWPGTWWGCVTNPVYLRGTLLTSLLSGVPCQRSTGNVSLTCRDTGSGSSRDGLRPATQRLPSPVGRRAWSGKGSIHADKDFYRVCPLIIIIVIIVIVIYNHNLYLYNTFHAGGSWKCFADKWWS